MVVRHQLCNALVPIITLLGLALPALFSGAVFVEAIFAWPGIGQVLVQTVQARDHSVVMAAATIIAGMVVVDNLLAEFLVALADPRPAMSRGNRTAFWRDGWGRAGLVMPVARLVYAETRSQLARQ